MRTAVANPGGQTPHADLATALRALIGAPSIRSREIGAQLPMSLALTQILSGGAR